MGLDIIPGDFSCSYGTFFRLRTTWEVLSHVNNIEIDESALELLEHSDCDGELELEYCDGIISWLEKLEPLILAKEDDWLHSLTLKMIKACKLAKEENCNLRFR